MNPDRHPPPSRHWTRRLRRALWRWRHAALAALVLVTAWTAIQTIRPPVDGEEILVLRRDVSAAASLTSSDVEVRTVPDAIVPDGAVTAPETILGRRLALGLPAGTPLTESVLVGTGLTSGLPTGHVVVPVRLADGEVAGFLRAGDTVDLVAAAADVAAAGGGAEIVAHGALVLGRPESGGDGFLLGSPAENALVLFGMPAQSAPGVIGANAWAPLRAVLVAPEADAG